MHHLVRFVVFVFLGFAMISCTVEDTMLHDWLWLFWFGRVCACAYNANRFMFQILVHFEFSQSIRTNVYCIYIFYGNVCLYIILIVPSDRCLDDDAVAVFCCFFFHRDASCGFAMARFAPIKWRTLLSGWCGVRTYIQYMVEIMV